MAYCMFIYILKKKNFFTYLIVSVCIKFICDLNAFAVSSFLYPVCDPSDNVEAVLNSVVTLTCPLTQRPEVTQVIWEVIQGGTAEKVASVANCSASCTIEANNNNAQRPLCKVREVQHSQKGTESLIISPVEITDAVWYRCTVQNRTGSYCSEIKISVKGLFLSKLNPFSCLV